MVLAQVALVAGQVLLKRGMGKVGLSPRPIKKIVANVAVGITFLTLWFLLWMRLLPKVDLSYIYPFEGISPILLAFAAWIHEGEDDLEILDWRGADWTGHAPGRIKLNH